VVPHTQQVVLELLVKVMLAEMEVVKAVVVVVALVLLVPMLH
jgi:hypothetical protein